MLKRYFTPFILALFILLSAGIFSTAYSAVINPPGVQQSGSVTPTDLTNWNANGKISDAGVALPLPPSVGGWGGTTFGTDMETFYAPNFTTSYNSQNFFPLTQAGMWISRAAANTYAVQPASQVLGQLNALDYAPTIMGQSGTTLWTTLQSLNIQAYVNAVNNNASESYDDVVQYGIERIQYPPNAYFKVNNPLIYPPHTDPGNVIILRNGVGTGGNSCATGYTGLGTDLALQCLLEPAVIFQPGSRSSGNFDIIGNTAGTDGGMSGWVDRTYQIKTITIANGAVSGTSAGTETCVTRNGDFKTPYVGATFTITHQTAGAADATSYTSSTGKYSTAGGIYWGPLPLLQQAWTAANGWNGITAPTSGYPRKAVFDGSGNMYADCTGGLIVSVTPTMWEDFPSGDGGYYGRFSAGNAKTFWGGDMRVYQARQIHDATYGDSYGLGVNAYDAEFDTLQTNLARIGTGVFGSDLRVNHWNDVNSAIQMKVYSGGSFETGNAIFDTPFDGLTNDAHALEVDKWTNLRIQGVIFHNSTSAATLAGAQVRIGSSSGSSSSNETQNAYLDFIFESDGTSGSNLTAISCANARDNVFNLHVSNKTGSGSARNQQYTTFASFGSNCETSNRFLGEIDNVSGGIFSGTVPAVGTEIYQPDYTAGPRWVYDNQNMLGFTAQAALDLSSNATGLSLPIGSSAARPASPTTGELRYNSTGYVEAYIASAWQNLIYGNVTGALKGNGTGGVTVANCADLGDDAPSCHTDTTNASNITSGTLPNAQVPAPTSGALGGAKSSTAASHQYATGLTTAGALTYAQPSASDLSDGLTGTGSVVRATSPALVSPTVSSGITITGTATMGAVTATTGVFQATSSSAFAIGANGLTNPAVIVDTSAASSSTGIQIQSEASGGGVFINGIGGGTNENLFINAKGTGSVELGDTGTGNGLILGSLGAQIVGLLSTNGAIAIGTSAANTNVSIDAGSRSDSALLPLGTTGQRPGTGINGMVRYNTTGGDFEGYIAGAWKYVLAGNVTGAIKSNSTGGVSQAACGDLSNAAASCSTDTTVASNITTGVLPAAQVPQILYIKHVTGRCYFGPTANTSSGGQLTNGANTGTTYTPFQMNEGDVPVGLGFFVSTAASAASFSSNTGIYFDSSGKPGTVSIDIGTTTTGTLTIASGVTGWQYQAIPIGNQTSYHQQVVWIAKMDTKPASGTAPNFTAYNTGSAGVLGYSWLGMATPSANAAIATIPTGLISNGSVTTLTNFANSPTVTYYNSSNVPAVAVCF